MRCQFRFFFFLKQKTAYERRISDWSSDVCSSDLGCPRPACPSPARYDRSRPDLPGPVCTQSGERLGRRHEPGACLPPHPLAFRLAGQVLDRRLAVDPGQEQPGQQRRDRKSVVKGKSVSVRVDLGGCRIIKTKNKKTKRKSKK